MRTNGVTIATSPALRTALMQAAAPVIAAWVAHAGTEAEEYWRLIAKADGESLGIPTELPRSREDQTEEA